jgi:methionyl aminopeptidase
LIVIKSPAEIALMRDAGLILAEALDAVQKAIAPGIETAELDAVAERTIRSRGATPTFLGVTQHSGQVPFPSTITASINEELVHGIPGSRVLCPGDIISIDCGATYRGYVADAAFTASVGQVTPDAQRLISVTERSLQVGIEQMRPGNRTGDVSAAIQRYVESQGFSVVREYTGHGVGRKMWEPPQVPNYGRPGRGPKLRPGMTIALEPMVNMGAPETKVMPDQWTVVTRDGKLCAHFEHSIAVTRNGPLVLTSLEA